VRLEGEDRTGIELLERLAGIHEHPTGRPWRTFPD